MSRPLQSRCATNQSAAPESPPPVTQGGIRCGIPLTRTPKLPRLYQLDLLGGFLPIDVLLSSGTGVGCGARDTLVGISFLTTPAKVDPLDATPYLTRQVAHQTCAVGERDIIGNCADRLRCRLALGCNWDANRVTARAS